MAAAAALGATSDAEASLVVLPNSTELTTPESREQMLAEGTVDGYQQDWTKKAQWISSNPLVARVDAAGEVSPVGDGEAVITAKVNGVEAAAKVKVRGSHAPFLWSFRNDVIPVMTKVGCNQGACHGALAGKHGFKLTLRGYAPEVDYDTLTRQDEGRRVSLADPAASLMLLKPTFTIPHGGGKRFSSDSLQFRILSGWIAEGAPPPSPKDPQVVGLEVFPKAATL
ncbi:MAG: Ig-like domain-containing protein, partial [Candidatus Binataceae bacterium]